ncbi:MAG: hypothetical protein ABGY75_10755 [Gemmataceae bacterium]
MTAPIDPTHARLAYELKHTSPLVGVRFDPTGRFLFAGAQDNTVQRFDLVTGKKTAFVGHKSWVRGIAFSPSRVDRIAPALVNPAAAVVSSPGFAASNTTRPFTLFTADYHGKLFWWDGAGDDPTPTRVVEAHDGWVRAVAVSPDGKRVATCGNDQRVRVWSATDGKLLHQFDGHASHVYNVAFHPTEDRLVSADLKGVIKDWDATTGKPVREFDAKVLHKYDSGFAADIGGARGMAFDATGQTLACTGITNVSNAFAGVGNPLVVLIDWATGKPKNLTPKDAFQGTGWGIHLHRDGFAVLGGGGGQGRLWFWKLADSTNVHTVSVPTNVRDMAVHPDGTALATAGFSGVAGIYTLTPPPPAAKPPEPKGKK